jgi:dUTP pyrophosphatase
MKIKIKKLTENAIIPKYMTSGSVGFDIHSNHKVIFPPECMGMVHTGLAVQIPKNTELTVRQRSGISRKFPNYIAIGIGTIDMDYIGEIMVPVINNNPYHNFIIKEGDRIAQCILSPIIQAEIEKVEELDDTDRGTGGFGSTGI